MAPSFIQHRWGRSWPTELILAIKYNAAWRKIEAGQHSTSTWHLSLKCSLVNLILAMVIKIGHYETFGSKQVQIGLHLFDLATTGKNILS